MHITQAMCVCMYVCKAKAGIFNDLGKGSNIFQLDSAIYLTLEQSAMKYGISTVDSTAAGPAFMSRPLPLQQERYTYVRVASRK